MLSKNYTLSKTDFKLAQDCVQKLVYKKQDYPTTNEENEYMQMLAEGGFIVGKMAQLLYPEGILVSPGRDTDKALAETLNLLKANKKIILFEAAIISGQKIARVDVLKKDGKQFELIEVKAKSWDSESEEDSENSSNQKKRLREYIEDVAYQTLVLREYLAKNFPGAKIASKLLMPDKSKRTGLDNLASWFYVSERTHEKKFSNVTVEFIPKGKESLLWEGGKDYCILQEMDVTEDISKLPEPGKKGVDKSSLKPILQEVEENAGYYLSVLNNGLKVKNKSELISKACFKCEFRANENDERDGYAKCLGKRAYAQHHISEMYYGGTIGGNSNPLINQFLLKNKELTIFEFKEEDFVTTKGEVGSRNARQLIQYRHTRENIEYVSDEMAHELASWKYPLHFIDFETYTGAIPMHKGMRPYEMVAFQWSCHTINKPGDEPVHSEWINDNLEFPNFKFAESLMRQIGEAGTPLMWATHENTVLCKILEQLENAEYYVPGYRNEKLKKWLLSITREKQGKYVIREGRLVDMNAFTLKHYFHPYMKGKTSIKKTLPAVWNHNPFLHKVPWFKPYYRKDAAGNILNPYETLKYRWEDLDYEKAEDQEAVKEGSGAMRAYLEMLFGKGARDKDLRDRLRQELLNYCELDTMAMVIIYEYWRNRI